MIQIKPFALILAILAVTYVRSERRDIGGFGNITVFSNEDPQSCTLTLSATALADQIKFSVLKTDKYQDCTHQDIKLVSIFPNDPSPLAMGQLTLTDSATANTQVASLTVADIATYNGSACILLKAGLGGGFNLDWYQCRLKFSNIYFHVNFNYYPQNNSIDDTLDNIIFPVLGYTTVSQDGLTVFKSNSSFPQLVGMFYTQCGGWSNVITDLNTPVTVTGTIQQGQVVNLATWLISYSINVIVIRKKNAAPSSYLVWRPQSPRFPFQHPGAGYCFSSDISLKYSDLVPDLNYCADGCLVNFMLQYGNTVIDLPTNGIVTKAPSLRA